MLEYLDSYSLRDRLPARLASWIQREKKDFVVIDGILYHLAAQGGKGTGEVRLVVPRVLRPEILNRVHTQEAAHPSWNKMATIMRRAFYWPRMIQDIKAFCDACVPCCRYMQGPSTRNPLQPIHVPRRRMALLGTDVVGPLPTSDKGNQYIITFVDYFSKWPEARAIESPTAEAAFEALMGEVISRHGAIETLVTDRDRVIWPANSSGSCVI